MRGVLSRLGHCSSGLPQVEKTNKQKNHGDEGTQRDGERGHERALLGRQRQQTDGLRSDLCRRRPGARHGREAGLHLAAAPQ